jgi:hypothetical protein
VALHELGIDGDACVRTPGGRIAGGSLGSPSPRSLITGSITTLPIFSSAGFR